MYQFFFTILHTLPHEDVSVIVKGYCQSITLPPSSRETITTSTQSGSTNSPQSVPTHSTQSDTTNSTQRTMNKNNDITIAPTKHFWFFRKFFFLLI